MLFEKNKYVDEDKIKRVNKLPKELDTVSVYKSVEIRDGLYVDRLVEKYILKNDEWEIIN